VNGKITSWRRYIDFAQHKERHPTARQLGIAVGIWVVGGENSSTTLTTALHPTAMWWVSRWLAEKTPSNGIAVGITITEIGFLLSGAFCNRP